MANFLSDIALQPTRTPRFGGLIGRLATIALPTGIVGTDTLQMMTLPKGAVIVDGFIRHQDLGTLSDYEVGLATNSSFFLGGFSGNSTSTVRFSNDGIIGTGPLTEDENVIVTCLLEGTPVPGAIIKVGVSYLLSP